MSRFRRQVAAAVTASAGDGGVVLRRVRAGKGKDYRVPQAVNDLDGSHPDSVWAVGALAGRPAIHRWNGSSWRKAALPKIAAGSLLGVITTSRTSAWAVGRQGKGETGRPLLLRWNGKGWRRLSTAGLRDGALLRVTPDGRGGVWATQAARPGDGRDELVHYSAGRWTTAKLPVTDEFQDFNSLVTVPGTTTLWALLRSDTTFDAKKELDYLLRYPR